MSLQPLLFPALFLFLSSIVMWFVLGCHGKWIIKLIVILASVAFSAEVYLSLNSYLGVPREIKAIQENVKFYWANINEPSKADKNPGWVYIWIRSDEKAKYGLLDLVPDKNDPISIKVKYSRELHEKILNMMKEVENNKKQPIDISLTIFEQRIGVEGGSNGGTTVSANIYILPPTEPPVKR